MTVAASVDEYIAGFPPEIQQRLQAIRAVIRQAAPHATERMAYGMPTYHDSENLVHFGASATHIGFYPTPSGVEHFADQLGGYKTSKGSIRFPLNRPDPLDLIREITLFRVEEAAAAHPAPAAASGTAKKAATRKPSATRDAGKPPSDTGPADIDTYIASFPPDRQEILRTMRAAIADAAPAARERIAWSVPSYYQNGWVVHFGMGKNHISLYPGSSGVTAFADRVGHLRTTKGAIQFPLDKPLPIDLIQDIVRFRVAEFAGTPAET